MSDGRKFGVPRLACIGLLISCVWFWLCAGCQSDGSVSVEGTVTLDGQPLAEATVQFISETGTTAGAVTDKNGRYVLTYVEGKRGVPPGKYKVRISTARGESETPDGKPIPAVPERIPMQYNAKTILEFSVEAGKRNVANFDLESRGQIIQAEG